MSSASNLKAPSRPSVRKPSAPALEAARDEPRPQGALTRQDIALAIADKCEDVSKREAKRLVDSGAIGQIQALLGDPKGQWVKRGYILPLLNITYAAVNLNIKNASAMMNTIARMI